MVLFMFEPLIAISWKILNTPVFLNLYFEKRDVYVFFKSSKIR